MSGEAQQVIEQFWRIQDEGDYTKLAPLFAEDAVVEDPVWGTHVGREAILGFMTTVRRQNIWHNSRRRLAECGPRLGLMFRRRACGVASGDVRVSFV